MNDERVLMDALHDLTAGQPGPPADRFTAVRRRHVRRRTTMAGAAALVAAVAVVGSFLLASAVTRTTPEPLNRPVPSWALPWPDHRDGSVSQKVLDGAVSAWRRFKDEGRPRMIVWYVGQTAVRDSWVVAVFEADTDSGRHLVVARAQASAVIYGQPAYRPSRGGPWVITDVPAPDPAPSPDLVGLNLADVNSAGIPNWILVLTRPTETSLHWEAPGSPGGEAELDRGLAVVDTGQVRGQVTVIFDRPVAQNGPVSPLPVVVPGDDESGAPQLEAARSVDTGGRVAIAGLGGQGSGAEGFGLSRSHARITVIARCYGRLEVHLRLDDGPFAANVPCDDRQHEFPGPRLRPRPGGGHTLFIDASNYTAYDIAIVKSK